MKSIRCEACNRRRHEDCDGGFDFRFPNGVDGEQPYAGVILNRGKVFGTTTMGGVNDSGTVFEITPPTAGFPAGVE